MATPTADEVARRVRSLVQDEVTPFRYSDADIIDSINDGLDRMVELRPDYFISSSFEPTRITALTDPLDVPWRLIYPMTLFTTGYMMLRDDKFATDGRAVNLLGAAGLLVTTTPGSEARDTK
jgi:hypothetical protein